MVNTNKNPQTKLFTGSSIFNTVNKYCVLNLRKHLNYGHYKYLISTTINSLIVSVEKELPQFYPLLN